MTLLFLGAMAVAVLVDQAKPNFSGTWTLVSVTDAAGNSAGDVGAKPVVAVVTQNDTH